jgi:hypothetical protein
MANVAGNAERVFKTAWFSKAAKKAHILDRELCVAIQQVMLGQCDDLGGGVYKKRLGKNLYRSIVLARGGRYWVYEYLFAKQDRANINDRQLANLRTLAATYASLSPDELREYLQDSEWVEICEGGVHDKEAKVQEQPR